MAMHEADSGHSQGFGCGDIDVNAFVRLAEILRVFNSVGTASVKVGAIVVDTCSSDMRALANLFELLTGTNIKKEYLMAVIRDDPSYMPNTDEFLQRLQLPIINTFFTPSRNDLAVGTLPSLNNPVESIFDYLRFTHNTCINIVLDDLHSKLSEKLTSWLYERRMCLDKELRVRGPSSVERHQEVVRQLLTSEARVVLVLLESRPWGDFMQALHEEMVMPGRFVIVTLQDERWSTSRKLTDQWPRFDQVLLSVSPRLPVNITYMSELAKAFSRLPYPQRWFRQFWMTAFKCNIPGERGTQDRFSKPCESRQWLNLTAVTPNVQLAPASFAVHAVLSGLTRLMESVCPGSLVQTLSDCVKEPQREFLKVLRASQFMHPLAPNGLFAMNGTDGYPHAELSLNRVNISQGVLSFEEVGIWDSEGGLRYTSGEELRAADHEGGHIQSSCPKASCWKHSNTRRKAQSPPTFREGLNDANTLIFTIVAIALALICLLCAYQQLVFSRSTFRICPIMKFVGLAVLSVVSVAFFMPPSAVICAIRRHCLSVALTLTVAPTLIKIIAIWKQRIIYSHAGIYDVTRTPTSATLFWQSAVFVVIQSVVVVEWSLFENPLAIEMTNFADHFMWRCSSGTNFERKLVISMTLNAVLLAVTVLCALANFSVDGSGILLFHSVISLLSGVGLYYGLPLLPFVLRDRVLAIATIVFVLFSIACAYAVNFFRHPYVESAPWELSDTLCKSQGSARPFVEAEHDNCMLGQHNVRPNAADGVCYGTISGQERQL